jgi:hypothetical protein
VLLHCLVERLSRPSDEKSGGDRRREIAKAVDEDRVSWAIGLDIV